MPEVNKSKVFLSYSRRDTQIASALERDLETTGLDVWMDRHDISVGERWSHAIQKALEDSHAMVLIISPDSMNSPNVEDEFTYFLDNKKPIVPVMVREAKLHFQLNRVQWIDFTGGATERAFEDLIRALDKVGVEFPIDTSDAAKNSMVAQLLDEIHHDNRRGQQRKLLMMVAASLMAVIVVGVLIAFAMSGGESPASVTPTPRPFVSGQIDSGGVEITMYSAPSRDSVAVRTLPNGIPVTVLQRTPDERFVQVQFGLDRGWVLARDVVAESIDEIAIFISPTPSPTPSPTQFITPSPTPSPSPTPEQVGSVPDDQCVVTIAPDTVAKSAHFEPSLLGFSEFDRVYPNESFVATARSGLGWLYVDIGWVQRAPDVLLSNNALCDTLPDDPTLKPDRFRQSIKNLGLVAQLRQGQIAALSPIDTGNLYDADLAAAQAWNAYGGFLQPLAELLNVDARLLAALVVQEAQLTGGEGTLPIRFEADIFEQFLTKEQKVEFTIHFDVHTDDPTQHAFRQEKVDDFVDYHTDTALEWQAFNWAFELNAGAALRAVRYGSLGVLGDNFYLMGYVTPEQFHAAMLFDPLARVIAKLDYVRSQPAALSMLRDGNWGDFGILYDSDDDRIGQQVAATTQTHYEALLRLVP